MHALGVCVGGAGVRAQLSGVGFLLFLQDLELGIKLRLSSFCTRHFYLSHSAAPSTPILNFLF